MRGYIALSHCRWAKGTILGERMQSTTWHVFDPGSQGELVFFQDFVSAILWVFSTVEGKERKGKERKGKEGKERKGTKGRKEGRLLWLVAFVASGFCSFLFGGFPGFGILWLLASVAFSLCGFWLL